ncbi:hypothetical protein FHS68_001497 [Dyadobacter arcticus]|uniref:Uncharacterized protein n=2 Tax=Dyadobacter arcticus TaxID=1078754 RepID=A0ABX0UMN2_9BACT|nr:hypothetical protein [Dyadobacter arcticus]
MEIPTSPAFVLMDQAPTIISRPANPKAFAVSILNSVEEANGIPKNYALEFTPFWFLKSKNMTALKYMGYNAAKGKQLPFSAMRMVSVSGAFVNTSGDSAAKNVSNIAIGAKTTLFRLRTAEDQKLILQAYKDILDSLKKITKKLALDPNFITASPSQRDSIANSLLKNYKKDRQINIFEILNRRPLLTVDGAIGYSRFFTDQQYSSGSTGRFGQWLVVGFTPRFMKDNKPVENRYLNIYGFLRHLSDGTLANDNAQRNVRYLDLGGKIELEFDKLILSFEAIARNKQNDDKNILTQTGNTSRSTGLIKYKITNNFYVTGSFGKNFDSKNNLISLFGVNWGINSGGEKAPLEK